MTTEPISDERLAEIRAGLVGCTPGPWVMEVETSGRVDESGEDRQPEVYVCSSDTRCDYTVVATMGRAEAISHERKSWDAAHIARLDPQTVAALLARLDKAEAGWQEKWADIAGYEGLYQVSSAGRVRKSDGTPVGQWFSRYMQVRLSNPRKVLAVHRLVAEAFLPNPDGKPAVNHIDFDPGNNSFQNLEWCTQAENIEHSRRAGRVRSDHTVGVRPAVAKLTDAEVREIRRLYEAGGVSYAGLAEEYDVSKRAIGRLISRETYGDV